MKGCKKALSILLACTMIFILSDDLFYGISQCSGNSRQIKSEIAYPAFCQLDTAGGVAAGQVNNLLSATAPFSFS